MNDDPSNVRGCTNRTPWVDCDVRHVRQTYRKVTIRGAVNPAELHVRYACVRCTRARRVRVAHASCTRRGRVVDASCTLRACGSLIATNTNTQNGILWGRRIYRVEGLRVQDLQCGVYALGHVGLRFAI